MKTILIGDIHGDYDALVTLLDRTKFNKDNDRLIVLGDFIDKGNKSYDVINLLKEYKESMKDRMVIIEGNHEYQFLYHGYNLFLRGLLFCLGRSKTKQSFISNGKDIHYFDEFLNNNMQTYYEDELFQACHASVNKSNIKEESKYTLVVNRFSTATNNYNGKLTITGHIALSKPIHFKGDGTKELLEYEVEKELPSNGIICIDTKSGNKLTAMVVEDNKYRLEYVDRTC